MKKTSIAIGLAALVFAAPAAAVEPKHSAEFDACMKASNSATLAMRDCLEAETKRWDARLNDAYKTLLKDLGDPEYLQDMNDRGKKNRDKLVEAQRLWLKFREQKCMFYADLTGGSIDRITPYMCTLDMTAHRALEFEALLAEN